MTEHLQKSRRGFLAVLGLAGMSATAAVTVAAPAEAQEESRRHFEHPSEYLAAMLAIGWRPVAMFQRLKDGGIHRLGVSENCQDKDHLSRTWTKFHAIQMRAPVMLVDDEGAVRGDWWKQVWQHLYDAGYREDFADHRL